MSTPRPEDILARRGSSFAWAGRFLPRDCRNEVVQLYAFCRQVDDLADRAEDRAAAARRLQDLDARLRVGDTRDPLAAQLLELARDGGFPLRPALSLVAGIRQDLGPVRIESREDLLRYAYRVAGTVGEMMCPLLGCRSAAALPFAIDLGTAMQLTNIARDVLEDAQQDRLYLPSDQLGASVTPKALVAGDSAARRRAWRVVLELLDLAEGYYRSSDRGLALLPPRTRAAILVSSRVYEAIGAKIRRAGESLYWRRRSRLGRAAYLWHTLRALAYLPRLSAGSRGDHRKPAREAPPPLPPLRRPVPGSFKGLA